MTSEWQAKLHSLSKLHSSRGIAPPVRGEDAPNKKGVSNLTTVTVLMVIKQI